MIYLNALYSVLPYSESVSFSALEPQHVSRKTHWSEREQDSSLTQWKMPALARGWFHKDWRKPLIPCRAQTLDSASIHISTTAASLRAAGACVCPEKWKKNRVFIYLYQTKLRIMLSVSNRTGPTGFDTGHESYRNLLICMQYTIYLKWYLYSDFRCNNSTYQSLN